MHIPDFPLSHMDWSSILAEDHAGETGTASWKTLNIADIRIRMVEFSANYLSDHWCSKGHLIQCLEGEINIFSKTGQTILLKKGMTCIVGNESDAHKTSSVIRCKLLIID